MPQVLIKGCLGFKKAMAGRGEDRVEAAGWSLGRLLDELARRWGPAMANELFESDAGGIKPHLPILINGVHYRSLPHGLDTVLRAGDQVVLFPPMTGG